jgi:hypothetical protein
MYKEKTEREMPAEIKEVIEQNRMILECNIGLIRAWMHPFFVVNETNQEDER